MHSTTLFLLGLLLCNIFTIVLNGILWAGTLVQLLHSTCREQATQGKVRDLQPKIIRSPTLLLESEDIGRDELAIWHNKPDTLVSVKTSRLMNIT